MTSTSTPARSLNGCWTCRIRRKKCDERRPGCSTCACLALDCNGYGPKPTWMDQGVLQQEQTLKLKQIVSQTKSRRLRQKSTYATHSLKTSDGQQTERFSSEPHPHTSPDQSGRIFQDDSQFQTSTPLAFEDLLGDSLFEDKISSSQQHLFQDQYIPTTSEDQISHFAINNYDIDFNTLFPQYLSIPTWTARRESNIGRGNGTSWRDNPSQPDGPSQEYSLPRVNPFPQELTINEASGSISVSRESSLSTFGSVCSVSQPIVQNTSIFRSTTEDALLMYYLDHVFYMQYPFFRSFEEGRGWLFSILTRAKAAYHATLALSEYHQRRTALRSISEVDSPYDLLAKDGHYYLAMREMQYSLEKSNSLSGPADIVQIIHVLTCMLQLLFLELLASGIGNWRTHINAAAALLPALVHARRLSMASALTRSEYEKRSQGGNSLLNDHDVPVKFLLGSFVSIDIIAAASTRSSLILEVDHKLVLEKLDIDLRHLRTCENWIMINLLEISQLDNWKTKAESSYMLSIVELARRGGQIRERLQRSLADIDNTPGSEFLPGNVSQMRSGRNHIEITRIFALSALTYLNVVLSGANPDLPEIAESVSQTVSAFQVMNEPSLLRDLVWPFCITGCLASEEQYSIFRGLIFAAGAKELDLGTRGKAFEIIEECWRLRKSGSRVFDWAFIMKSLRYDIVLA